MCVCGGGGGLGRGGGRRYAGIVVGRKSLTKNKNPGFFLFFEIPFFFFFFGMGAEEGMLV